MNYFKKLQFYNTLMLLSLLLFTSCAKIDPVTGKKKIIEPNAIKKAQAVRDKGGGILGGKASNDNSKLLGNSNIMWNAALNSLDNIPLSQTDYSGGIIITDWYGTGLKNGKSEEIKITVKFVSNELSPASFNVISYKKVCIQFSCETTKLGSDFSNKIKNNITNEMKKLKIAEETQKK